MPTFERDGVSIYYEEYGAGFPLLLLAPGGVRSSIPFWKKTPYDPIAAFSPTYRVIALDQRNAGKSRASIAAGDGWSTYTADHLALLDHLEVARAHVLGNCIGGSFGLALVAAAPTRVASAVLQQPIGLSADNRLLFHKMFDDWARELAPDHPEATPADFASYRANLFDGDFVFSVTREQVRAAKTPLLVLAGNDDYHPTATSEEIASLAPNAELVRRWKDAEVVPETVRRVRSFLASHTPA
ncbi:MAG: alpha/beta hydrolase [Polyangiales bacterium]